MTMRTMVLVAGTAACLGIMGCEEKQSTTTGGNALTKAAESATKVAGDTTKAVGDTAQKGLDAAKDAGAKVAEGAKDMGDAAKDTLEKAKTEAGAWMSDVVEKQWPAAKTTLEEAAKKVTDIKAPDVKAKAEGLVKELQGAIPGIEATVTKLKNAAGSEFSTLFSEAKTQVEGFMGKLGDLKKMVGM